MRTAATAGALTVVAGCSLRVGQPSGPATAPAPGADELARERVAEQSEALAASAASIAAPPDAARQLALIVRQHREHAAALRPVPPSASGLPTSSATTSPPTTATTTGKATATATATATAGGNAASAAVATALTHQAAAERAGASDVEPELAKVSGDVARLLASVAACRTVHAQTLDRLATAVHR
jgi:hypothetical protein